ITATPNSVAPTTATSTHALHDALPINSGGLTGSKAVVLSITDTNDVAPTITSAATGSEAENTAATNVVYQIIATDPDTVGTRSYSLSGTDAGQFNIDSATGAVTFKVAPDFEAPTDANGGSAEHATELQTRGQL